MVEIFKTNIRTKKKSEMLLLVLRDAFPSHKINFDLDDCDKILRVEGDLIESEKIISLLNASGHECKVLE